MYLAYWLQESGVAEILPSLRPETVYVGVSAGAMAATPVFGETYDDPPRIGRPLTSGDMVFATPGGELRRTFVTAQGVGLVEFSVIPHLGHDDHPDASLDNAERWAARLPLPTYALDDQTAVLVTDGTVEVVTEGTWRLFTP